MGGEVGIDGSDVAPIAPFLVVACSRHAVPGEVVGKHPFRLNQARQQILAEILLSQAVTLTQCGAQYIGGKNVVAHRREGARGIVGHGTRIGRLFPERADGTVAGGIDDPEGRGHANRHRQRSDGHVGTVLQVEGDHLADIHAIEVVGTKDHDQVRRTLFDQPEVLIDRV
jgi:hypothetical protein